MKKNKSFYKKRLMRNKTSAISIMVAAIFILSSAAAAIDISDKQVELNTLDYEVEEHEHKLSVGTAPTMLSIGSAPTAMDSYTQKLSNSQGNNYLPVSMAEPNATCYTNAVNYQAPEGEGVYKFNLQEPGDLEKIGDGHDYLFNGGTWTCEGKFLVAEHFTGALYEINTETGEIISIGGGGTGLNALAMDPTTRQLYGGSATGSTGGLWKIDDTTGDQEYVGDWVATNWVIGMSINSYGECYAYDISPDYLYKVDLETGEAESIGYLGYNMNYAQDCHFYFNDSGEDVLYLTAYTLSPYGGSLMKADLETGELTMIEMLESNAECSGTAIPFDCIPPEHDVALQKIVRPEDGYAYDPIEIELLVKNWGNNSEVTDVQFEIIKCEEGPLLLEEDFSSWVPAGWSHLGYRSSYTQEAGGFPPEAAYLYSYPYTHQGWLMTAPLNATGFEKISMKFRMYCNFRGYANTFFYLQYRKNDTSPWRDASSWANPIEGDLGPGPFEIGCYGWGEDLGSEFQARWQFGNYYWYLEYGSGIYIDDVQVIGCAGCAEYAEIEEDVEVPFEEEVLVEMPGWTPSEWRNPDFQDTWEEYPLSAYTLLEDDNARNNKKQRLLKLYYPFLHDVGTFKLGEMETGPAQTFAAETMIKNVGQYDECCFKTHIAVGEIDYDTAISLMFEDFYPYYQFPPDGWDRTHTNWYGTYSNYCQQGDYAEARFYRYPYTNDVFRLISAPMDTTGYGGVTIKFVQYLNHYYGSYFDLRVETSPDAITWTTVWETTPSGDIFTPEWIEVSTGENVGGDEFYVAFTFVGYSVYCYWWHIDSVSVHGHPVVDPEYEDELCISEIDVQEEIDLEFDDWTPDFLQYETSGVKNYLASTWTEMNDPPDNNRVNDRTIKSVILDYFHDMEALDVASPIEQRERRFYATRSGYPGQTIWFDPEDPTKYNDIGTFPSNNFPQGATFIKDIMWVCDTNGNIYKDLNGNPDDPDWEFVGNAGAGTGFVSLAYHQKNKILYGIGGNAGSFYEVDQETGKATLIGNLGTGTLMISCAANADGEMYSYDLGFGTAQTYTINLETGKATRVGPVGINVNFGQDMAYDWDEDKMYATAFNYGTFCAEFHEIDMETGKFNYISNLEACAQTTCFAIPGGGVPIEAYVAPGNQNIEGIIANIGTFPERDMTCYASIDEFITNCTNGTNVYEDMIEGIDVLEPLTGTKSLTFNDYLFVDEGVYVLTLEIVDDNDDNLKNNILQWGIGCDDTAPVSSHTLTPADPDGENDYYVSNLTVAVSAYDPGIGCETDGSGVKEIKYTINGAGDTITGDSGEFQVTEDGNNIEVEYWAIDWVGNVESKNSFIIDMDQTLPVIDEDGVHWEAFRDNPTSNVWYVRFWTNATDATSGMDRVEMYINEGLHEINASPDGKLYEFVLMWSTAFETVTFLWEHYDRAGWHTDDEILGNEPFSKSYSSETRNFNQKQVRSL
jgi:hypothetical protein